MSMNNEEIIPSMNGKVLKKNENKTQFGESIEWTPFNAEMNMQGIKVLVSNPAPKKVGLDSSFEDTMMLLEMIKDKKQKENKKLKDERIREMAMEKKMKNEKSRNQYIKLSF